MELTTRNDLDALLAFLVEFAQIMLREQGEFYPFASGMKPTGEMTAVGADTGHPHPPSDEVIAILFSTLAEQAQAREIKAAGICMDVRVIPPGSEQKTDAVCVELEHEDGAAVHVFLPYVIKAPGVVTYGDIFATPGDARIFLSAAG